MNTQLAINLASNLSCVVEKLCDIKQQLKKAPVLRGQREYLR